MVITGSNDTQLNSHARIAIWEICVAKSVERRSFLVKLATFRANAVGCVDWRWEQRCVGNLYTYMSGQGPS